ncbi:hypothetical protein V6N13_015022 [Hibiscus sabdariffa]
MNTPRSNDGCEGRNEMVASVAANLAIHHSFERSGRERDCEPWSESARVVEVALHPFAAVVYHGVKENEETE